MLRAMSWQGALCVFIGDCQLLACRHIYFFSTCQRHKQAPIEKNRDRAVLWQDMGALTEHWRVSVAVFIQPLRAHLAALITSGLQNQVDACMSRILNENN